jgi:hypothetical protein
MNKLKTFSISFIIFSLYQVIGYARELKNLDTEIELYNLVCAPQTEKLKERSIKFKSFVRNTLYEKFNITSNKIYKKSITEYIISHFKDKDFDVIEENIVEEKFKDIEKYENIRSFIYKNINLKLDSENVFNIIVDEIAEKKEVRVELIDQLKQSLINDFESNIKRYINVLPSIHQNFCVANENHMLCAKPYRTQLEYSYGAVKNSQFKKNVNDESINHDKKVLADFLANFSSAFIENSHIFENIKKINSKSQDQLKMSFYDLKNELGFSSMEEMQIDIFFHSITTSKVFVESYLTSLSLDKSYKTIKDRFNKSKEIMIKYFNKHKMNKIIHEINEVEIFEYKITDFDKVKELFKMIDGFYYLNLDRVYKIDLWSSFFAENPEDLYTLDLAYYTSTDYLYKSYYYLNKPTVFIGQSYALEVKDNLQYVDLVLLHEISHHFGRDVVSRNGRFVDTNKYFKRVWDNLEKSIQQDIGVDEAFSDWLAVEVLMNDLTDPNSILKPKTMKDKFYIESIIQPFCGFINETNRLRFIERVHPHTIIRIEDIFGSHPLVRSVFNLSESKYYIGPNFFKK